jgi:hypothetical protein
MLALAPALALALMSTPAFIAAPALVPIAASTLAISFIIY